MAQAPIDMAESNRSGSIDSPISKYGLLADEIREETLQTESQEGNKHTKFNAFCDLCFVLNFSKIYASCLCYLCKKYVCGECYERHDKSHRMIELENKRGERETRREFLVKIRKERKREKMFERENVTMVDRVNVKYGLDHNNCSITGLCGLKNTSWVVCDHYNYCIKLFNVGSNLIHRYIRLGSAPWDVTEIKIKREPIEQAVMSTGDISVINQVEWDEQCLLAVTFQWKRIILIIDVTQNPAVITKSIKTNKDCYSIDFSGDYMFTLCCDGVYRRYGYGPWFVSVMSTDGVTIKTINTHLSIGSYPYLAVCHGGFNFYITDPNNHKVLCLNDEGKVVSPKTIEGSWPGGVSADPDTNHVYICASGHDKLYRLDSSLESLEPLFDFKSVNSDRPKALCLFRDKLYVSHSPVSKHGNYVTVVIVL